MKIWTASFNIFPYSFDEVCSVFYDRYPNSFATHIISEDVLSREITQDKIVTKKLIVKQGNSILKRLPRWMSSMTQVKVVPTLEESIFDRHTQNLTTYTRNVGHVDLFDVHERCIYQPALLVSEKSGVAASRLLRSVYINVNAGRTSKYLYEKLILIGFQKSVASTIRGFNEKLEERFGTRPLLDKETALHQLSEKSHKLKEKLRDGAKEKLREGAHLVNDQIRDHIKV